MKSKKFLLAVLLIGVAAFGAIVFSAPACPEGTYDLAGTRWVLASLNRKAPIKDQSSDLSLSFQDTYADGHGGCNGFRMDYSLEGAEIQLSPAQFRYVGCSDAINKQEDAYLRSLGRAACVQILDGQLFLTGRWAELVFTPITESP